MQWWGVSFTGTLVTALATLWLLTVIVLLKSEWKGLYHSGIASFKRWWSKLGHH